MLLPIEIFSLHFDISHAIAHFALADLPLGFLLSGTHLWLLFDTENWVCFEEAGRRMLQKKFESIREVVAGAVWLDRTNSNLDFPPESFRRTCRTTCSEVAEGVHWQQCHLDYPGTH